MLKLQLLYVFCQKLLMNDSVAGLFIAFRKAEHS
jgi:hypothetical protein